MEFDYLASDMVGVGVDEPYLQLGSDQDQSHEMQMHAPAASESNTLHVQFFEDVLEDLEDVDNAFHVGVKEEMGLMSGEEQEDNGMAMAMQRTTSFGSTSLSTPSNVNLTRTQSPAPTPSHPSSFSADFELDDLDTFEASAEEMNRVVMADHLASSKVQMHLQMQNKAKVAVVKQEASGLFNSSLKFNKVANTTASPVVNTVATQSASVASIPSLSSAVYTSLGGASDSVSGVAPMISITDINGVEYLWSREDALKRYREKRARRCFKKVVRYDCRKKIAASRPRIGGRFARKGEMDRISSVVSLVSMAQETELDT
eukprot:CAMPEP_0184697712 /NCGR_PEP_ID=MMETSP0313-20130426/4586_1 /TAXON_ID=2792 /ORGANISM="Porphyridium aerugineum, Strain SAG 1380-2" /LENGTH=315 /DNA_ID=CAMNT_0027156545 /DNA_START=188 /DNA_END=1135 /DNA_ORIENTATION=+